VRGKQVNNHIDIDDNVSALNIVKMAEGYQIIISFNPCFNG